MAHSTLGYAGGLWLRRTCLIIVSLDHVEVGIARVGKDVGEGAWFVVGDVISVRRQRNSSNGFYVHEDFRRWCEGNEERVS